MTTQANRPVQPVITSIGVERGKCIVRIIINGSRRTLDTNLVSFAMLAQAGVQVANVS